MSGRGPVRRVGERDVEVRRLTGSRRHDGDAQQAPVPQPVARGAEHPLHTVRQPLLDTVDL
ncbi:hypothetical protein ACRAWF_43575 [Streptomyces sp. L7]